MIDLDFAHKTFLKATNADNVWIVNKKKKTVTFLKYAWYKKKPEYVKTVKCNEEDQFNEKIGIALSIERFNAWNKGKNEKARYKYMRSLFITNGELDYEKYADWVIMDCLYYYQDIDVAEVISLLNIKYVD